MRAGRCSVVLECCRLCCCSVSVSLLSTHSLILLLKLWSSFCASPVLLFSMCHLRPSSKQESKIRMTFEMHYEDDYYLILLYQLINYVYVNSITLVESYFSVIIHVL